MVPGGLARERQLLHPLAHLSTAGATRLTPPTSRCPSVIIVKELRYSIFIFVSRRRVCPGPQSDALKDQKEGEESDRKSDRVLVEPSTGNREKPHDSCSASGATWPERSARAQG